MKESEPRSPQRRGFFVQFKYLSAVILLSLIVPFLAAPSVCPAQCWTPLMQRLISDGYNEQQIESLFSRPELVFESDPMSSKLQALIRTKFEPPLPLAPGQYKSVYEGYLKADVIAGASSYLEKNKALLEAIQLRYGVPKEIIVSILLVETRLGQFTGTRCAFNTLASMALCTELETISPCLPEGVITPATEGFARQRCRQKADWAYHELKALIDYAGINGVDPYSIRGSAYGAIGLCQFMPSQAFIFGVDADGDGRVDLFTAVDALHSIANYLKKNGWKCRMNRAQRQKVILSYNHSLIYANTVLAVAEKIRPKIPVRVAVAAPK